MARNYQDEINYGNQCWIRLLTSLSGLLVNVLETVFRAGKFVVQYYSGLNCEIFLTHSSCTPPNIGRNEQALFLSAVI
jgi:hypothetical protein